MSPVHSVGCIFFQLYLYTVQYLQNQKMEEEERKLENYLIEEKSVILWTDMLTTTFYLHLGMELKVEAFGRSCDSQSFKVDNVSCCHGNNVRECLMWTRLTLKIPYLETTCI